MMSMTMNRAFVWRTASVCLLIFDYFLFVTGNPSITYSVLGGWFEIPLVTAVIIVTFYAYHLLKERREKRLLVTHVLTVGLFSAALLTVNSYARDNARDRFETEIASFVRDPANAKVVASDEARALMAKIATQKYSEEREAFIPTFRRMDYLFKTEVGEKYRLVMTMGWNGAPEISFRSVDS
jgi:hypothetical protein